MRNDPERIYTPKRDETDGLALFEQPRPRIVRPLPKVECPGASQAAREAIAPHLNALQAKVLATIVAYQPCTRDTLCEVLAMNPSTLRPRVKELLDLKRVRVSGYTADSPRRELLAATTPEEG